jgi:hypothetical protein
MVDYAEDAIGRAGCSEVRSSPGRRNRTNGISEETLIIGAA